MPFLILNFNLSTGVSSQFKDSIRTYLEKEGYSPSAFPGCESRTPYMLEKIPLLSASGFCSEDEYILFDSRSIFDIDLNLFIATCRIMEGEFVSALRYTDEIRGKVLYGVDDRFSLYRMDFNKDQYVDGYESGGIYYFRGESWDRFLISLDSSRSSDISLDPVRTFEDIPCFRRVIRGLPMGGCFWSAVQHAQGTSDSSKFRFEEKRVPALFLDRDGVIVEDTGYVHGTDLKFIERIFPLIEKANGDGDPVIVVTNQSGVARGYFAEADVEDTHSFIRKYLDAIGLRIDGFYCCPFHPEGIGKYSGKRSLCRKPEPGMILRACEDFSIDLSKSLMLGDMERDRIKLPYLDFHIFG